MTIDIDMIPDRALIRAAHGTEGVLALIRAYAATKALKIASSVGRQIFTIDACSMTSGGTGNWATKEGWVTTK